DEALVVFDSARQALRSAIELQARVAAAELPRGIGVGLDAGEAVPVADGYRGGALNLAARLCSLAGPGEVLASETVLQLALAGGQARRPASRQRLGGPDGRSRQHALVRQRRRQDAGTDRPANAEADPSLRGHPGRVRRYGRRARSRLGGRREGAAAAADRPA